jgi:hypothetical protein
MHDGTSPIDRAVPHLASSGLWTHSAYWDLDSVARDIAAALGTSAGPAVRYAAPAGVTNRASSPGR